MLLKPLALRLKSRILHVKHGIRDFLVGEIALVLGLRGSAQGSGIGVRDLGSIDASILEICDRDVASRQVKHSPKGIQESHPKFVPKSL